MACSKQDNVSKSTGGKAMLGCFMEHEKIVYAIVCRHFTRNANDSFYVKDFKSSPFARKIKKDMKDPSEKFTENDIDLIEVINDKEIRSVFRNATVEIPKEARIFEGRVGSLVGKEVFQCNKADSNGPGTILPQTEISKILKESYDMERHFVIGGSNFAEPGDSGRVVGYETNGFLELVGLIVHQSKEGTVCLLLKDGVEYLNTQYVLDLEMCKSPTVTTEGGVEPGQVVTF